MEPLILYHADCLDGFAAAWVAWHAYPDATFLPVAYNKPPPDVADKHVFILDFSYPPDIITDMLRVAKHITMIDHHESTLQRQYPLNQKLDLILDTSRCGAWLTLDYFRRQEEGKFSSVFSAAVERLIEYIDDQDRHVLQMPRIHEVIAVLAAVPRTMPNWTKLAVQMHENAMDVFTQGAIILAARTQLAKEIAATAVQATWLWTEGMEDKVALPAVVCNCPHGMTGIVFELLVQQGQDNPDLVIFYQDSGASRRFSLRSTATGPIVRKLAECYGGGGHDHAAGFTMKTQHGNLPYIVTDKM